MSERVALRPLDTYRNRSLHMSVRIVEHDFRVGVYQDSTRRAEREVIGTKSTSRLA